MKSIIKNPGQFPVDKLPKEFQDAVEGYRGETQAPVELLVSLILSSASSSIQDSVVVHVREGLEYKPTLYVIIVAPSGERKTFSFNLITSAIRTVQHELTSEYIEKQRIFNRDVEIWKVEESMAKKSLKDAIKHGLDPTPSKTNYRLIKDAEPVKPIHRKLIFNDITIAGVKKQLGSGNRSFSIMSDEAGRILSMDFMKETSDLNDLWSRGALSMERGTGNGIQIDDASVGLTLMVQPRTFHRFLANNGEMARDSGFFARCLIAVCESTQGTRFKEHCKQVNNKALKWFDERITTLLHQGIERRTLGKERYVIKLSKEALVFWELVDSSLEPHLAPGGQLEAYRDYASKFVEHMTRLAAVIEVFLNGYESTISISSMLSAYDIANWYFDNFIQLMGAYDMANQRSHARILDEWLRINLFLKDEYRIEKRRLRQYVTSVLRSKALLDPALNQLVLDNRVRVYKEGRTEWIEYIQAKCHWESKQSLMKFYSHEVRAANEHQFISYEEQLKDKYGVFAAMGGVVAI